MGKFFMIVLRNKNFRQIAVGGMMAGVLALPVISFAPQHSTLGISAAALAAQNNFGSGKYTPAPSKSEIVIDKNELPVLNPQSVDTLRNAIAMYDIIVRRGGWPKVSTKKALVRGSKNKAVIALRQRLAAEGYPVIANSNSKKFDNELDRAVKMFQARHGLHIDGKVSRNTLKALNMPAFSRLHTLRQNLPRVEKYTKDIGERYVMVNIPAAQLEAVEYGRVYSRHNTVVGKKERPSPILASTISELNFNPYWHAPVSIVEKDILPEVRKNVGWLKKMKIKIFDGYDGPEVDPKTIDFSTVDPKRYMFRQEPGGANAMASVKINFPNKYSVYLHDTPGKQLFKQASRYYSSGCVRVDKVHILTEWLVRGQEDWNRKKIDQLTKSEERVDLTLENPAQLRIVYLTAWAQPDGSVHFRPDTYNLDGTGFVAGQPVPLGEQAIAYAPDGTLLDAETGLKIDKAPLQEQAKQREIQVQQKQVSKQSSFFERLKKRLQNR
jgi:murein L,D-transpeptidase YcbB/YkuD